MNRIIMMGRLTADPQVKTTNSGVSVLAFSVAVDREYTPKGAEKQTDFINCVAWRQTADFIARYFTRGQMIALEGALQSRNYDDKNGVKRTVWEVIVDRVHFCGGRNEGTKESANGVDIAPDAEDEDLPF